MLLIYLLFSLIKTYSLFCKIELGFFILLICLVVNDITSELPTQRPNDSALNSSK